MCLWSNDWHWSAIIAGLVPILVNAEVNKAWYPMSTNALEIVEHKDYALGYWKEMGQAAWVVEELTPAKLTRACSRSGTFRPDPKVSTGSAVTMDYTRSGYDRGHLAPAADFICDAVAMRESFVMSNISPQVPNLNRGPWAALEEWTRSVATGMCVTNNGATTQSLVVVTGPIITGAVERIGASGVAVPHGFFKALYVQTPPSRMFGFVYWNRANEPKSVADHAVAVDEIERMTGLDLFAVLPDEDEQKLEMNHNPRSSIHQPLDSE